MAFVNISALIAFHFTARDGSHKCEPFSSFADPQNCDKFILILKGRAKKSFN